MNKYQKKVILKDMEQAQQVLGLGDAHVKLLEKQLQISVVARGQEVLVSGEEQQVALAMKVIDHLIALAEKQSVDESDVQYALTLVHKQSNENLTKCLTEVLQITSRGKQIRAKTFGQYRYVKAMESHDITFGIGPAGTGKTYLAVVMAVKALKTRKVDRIILTRPAVEAGEKLGFLPGDLQEKVDPYLRPLYDGLNDVLGADMAQKYIERQIIEIAPLAYMRGRTLENAFIILDEAQNTTPEQMKMFLTRIGFGSKAVVTGDITQIDLPKSNQSGLLLVQSILQGIDEISFHHLSAEDVVRHPVVAKIIAAYEAVEPPR